MPSLTGSPVGPPRDSVMEAMELKLKKENEDKENQKKLDETNKKL